MTALWIGLAGAAVLIGVVFLVPCPACQARRERMKQALTKVKNPD